MMGEYEPRDSRNVTGTASTPDGRWTIDDAKPPKGVPDPEPSGRPRQQDDLPPETHNSEQDDEDAQAQTVAEEARRRAQEEGLSDSVKDKGPSPGDAPDLVDRMRQMNRSGRIDYGAFRGERNDDDEEDTLGPAAKE
jgi:hypothetical protein